MNQHYFDVPFAFSGDVTAIPDPLQTGGTVSFTEGWNYNYQRDLATDPAALPIDRSTMNWLLLQITAALQALQQQGVPEWITAAQNGGTAFSYGKGATVLWSASGSAPFTKFVSLTAANTNTPSMSDPTGATTGWQIVVDPISTSAQAAAGTDNASIMTPLLVAQQTALRALLAGSSSQVFNVGTAVSGTQAPQLQQLENGSLSVTFQAITSQSGYGGTGASTALAIGAGGASPNAASISWGDGTGYKLNYGPKISGAFAPRIVFVDSGKLLVGSGTTPTDDGSGAAIQTTSPVSVGAPTQSQHAVQGGQLVTQSITAYQAGGTASAWTLTPSPALTGYSANQRFRVKFPNAGVYPNNTLNISGLGAVALMQYDSNGNLQPANITAGLLTDVEYNGSTMVVLDAIQASTGMPGDGRNIACSLGAASSTLTYTTDSFIVSTALGAMSYQIPSLNKTLNIGLVGAGGMSTSGYSGTGFVGVYAIYNPMTGASALLGVNATGFILPTICASGNLPSGYTASALLGVWPTNSSTQFIAATQYGRTLYFPSISVGTGLTATTYTAYGIATTVPGNAKFISGSAQVYGAATSVLYLSGSSLGFGEQQIGGYTGAAEPPIAPFNNIPLITTQTFYYKQSGSTGPTIYISNYTI